MICKSKDACSPSEICNNGGCCPAPMPKRDQTTTPPQELLCPDNRTASGPCTGPGSCGQGQYCYNFDRCCSIPVCPNGLYAVQPCFSEDGCPIGFRCQDQGCCPVRHASNLFQKEHCIFAFFDCFVALHFLMFS